MELKVRLLEDVEPKGVQELERELVENYEQQLEAEAEQPQKQNNHRGHRAHRAEQTRANGEAAAERSAPAVRVG